MLLVMGTRPEVIKTAPVISALKKTPGLHPILIGTGQHRSLLDQMLHSFSLSLDENMRLMRPGQSPTDILSKGITRLTACFQHRRPALVLVQGDTTSALAGALAAFHLKIPVGHIEAGLRSGDLSQPFPEEMNRSVIDDIARLHFAPTQNNARTLIREGAAKSSVFITGNTVVDSVKTLLKKKLAIRNPKARQFSTGAGRKILLTAHRRESFGVPLQNIFGAISDLVKTHEDLRILYPIHPNPEVHRAAKRRLTHPRITLCDPLDYFDFLKTAQAADLIMSDSGGVQEEAPTLKTPIVVLRNITERGELIARNGWGKLSGTNRTKIVRDASSFLKRRKKTNRAPNPFGDGRSGPRIAAIIKRWLS